MKIGIVGYGHVGTAMSGLFPNAVIYDEPRNIGTKEEINDCDVAFVCVPTPMKADGSCDVSIVESVLDWLDASVIVLRSTVPVGFTETQADRRKKKLVFQPEYYGETVAHPFADLRYRQWITLGGKKEEIALVVEAYQSVYTSEVIINVVDSRTAELAKYMENCFLAAKVTFCNEFYDIAQAMDVDYNQLRETWLLDPRMGRSHTFVYPNDRGFAGSCLPKDLSSMIVQAKDMGVDVTMLQAIADKNAGYHKENE